MKAVLVALITFLATASSALLNTDTKISPVVMSEGFMYTVRLNATIEPKVSIYCSGAQLGLEWVITAAECLDKVQAVTLAYAPGNLSHRFRTFKMVTAEHAIHPKYDARTKANNLGLIRCRFCGQLDDDKLPKIPLPNQLPNSFANEPAVITSLRVFGVTTDMPSFFVYFINTKIVSQFWCKLSYIFSVGKEHICASSRGGKFQENEIGVPLVIQGDSKESIKLVGIATSIEPWTTWPSLPKVYTRVAPYADWIMDVTKAKVFFSN